jgi:adenosylcobinamide kinase/adenosylcobinamide-phosphate guanylyltransferase
MYDSTRQHPQSTPGQAEGSLTVVLGGARSGKSSFAVHLGQRAAASGRGVAFIATSPRIPGDDDLEARIAAHRSERPAAWLTIEEEVDVPLAVNSVESTALVIVDCVTVWVSNLMHRDASEQDVLDAANQVLAALHSRSGPSLLISNEVGMGIVPMNALARSYRDLLGRVNQRFVAASDTALLMVAGRALPLVDFEMA